MSLIWNKVSRNYAVGQRAVAPQTFAKGSCKWLLAYCMVTAKWAIERIIQPLNINAAHLLAATDPSDTVAVRGGVALSREAYQLLTERGCVAKRSAAAGL